ncbi:hypothetical protein PRIPAC_92375 [Pristionchus pacificus]|uniref:Uncharacterized protein n=1 Tax=Pristionchus pacificus TaxID=54126 RepID=A0A2A6BAX6_PRIPA|nr:hypothetical protein PRIPAC_92375 [Pristionchus pacificus]|eukprot:PDM63028.1 hypothetical protein PRIPAC_50243 [Pristionchus pacificus]
MDDDDETWLTPGLSSASKDKSGSSSKGTQSDLDSWLSTTSSAIDFSTRSALSRRLKGYSDKKGQRRRESAWNGESPDDCRNGRNHSARRRQLRSASTVSLESVSEESSPRKQSVEEKEEEDTVTLIYSSPLAQSSPLVAPPLDRSRSLGYDSIDSPYGADEEDEEYKKLEEAALGLSLQSEEEEEVREVETTQDDDDEFLSAASEFEDEELEAAHHNGRSRELESLDEEPARVARQQVLGARLGVTPRSSSVSPRLAATVHPTSTPKAAIPRVERVSADIYSTPVGTLNTLPRRPTLEANKTGAMSVSLHMPSGHLPPRRIPPGRGVENGKSPLGGGGGKEADKKVNLHEDLAKIQNVAREQEEALRREVMGSLSANDVSNGENDSRLITNNKSVEFVGKKEFHSRLPTPSRRVIPMKGRGGGGPPTTTAALPLRATPNSVVMLSRLSIPHTISRSLWRRESVWSEEIYRTRSTVSNRTPIAVEVDARTAGESRRSRSLDQLLDRMANQKTIVSRGREEGVKHQILFFHLSTSLHQ